MFTILVLLIVGLVNNIQCDQSSPQNQTILEKFLYKRCQKYSINAADYDKIKTRLDDFTSYVKYTTNLIPDGRKEFCDDERPKLENLMRTLGRDVITCFPKEEKYLPDFLSESFKGFLNFLCEQNGKNMINFFSTQSADCRAKLAAVNAKEQIKNCFSKIFAPLNNVVSKSNLCSDISTAHKCFEITAEEHCSDYRAFKVLVHRFFNHISAPCSSPSSALSTHQSLTASALLTIVLITSFY